MDTFTIKFDEKIRHLMDKIDQVRSILPVGEDGITFPNVVVVGDQSSGKSTLLEALSLVELPKGAGIVTRCPLVLRLRQSNERRVYRIHDDNEKTLLNEKEMNVSKYIEDETTRLAGADKNVVKDLIELLVEDPDMRDLTIVDLPGIARNPIAHQPEDIHKQTTDLIRHFIRPEGTVILCVCPANVDIATVESFTLAREVDPLGVRTIGVITKCDLATNDDVLCQQLLMQKEDVLQLKLGFIAVRNRAADEKLSLTEARSRERDFFNKHISSSVVGTQCLGVGALITCLANLYAERVNEAVPNIRSNIERELVAIAAEMKTLPDVLDTHAARLCKYYELCDVFVENLVKLSLSSPDQKHASLLNMFHEKFKKFEVKLENQAKKLQTEEYASRVRVAISAYSGEQLCNFLPYVLLKRLICEQMDQIYNETETLIDDCFMATRHWLMNEKNCSYKDQLPKKLLSEFVKIVDLYMKKQKKTIKNQLGVLIRIEKNDPYTLNSDYITEITKLNNSQAKHLQNDENSVQDMLRSVRSYWQIVRKRFTDYAALTIRTGLVFDIKAGISERLRSVPLKQIDFIDECFAEVFTQIQRKNLQNKYAKFKKVYIICGGQMDEGDSFDTLGKWIYG